MLSTRGYESDPMKAWKKAQARDEAESEAEEEAAAGNSGTDYGYLLSMPILSLSKEKKDELLKQRDGKVCINMKWEYHHIFCVTEAGIM